MKKLSDFRWLILTSSTLLVYCLLFGLQGFDLTDEGFMLVAYQNVLTNPECSNYAFPLYLTTILGGLWNTLFGNGGWYSFRIFNALIIVCAYILIVLMLKKYLRYRWYIFFAFFIVVANMIQQHGMLIFHYYTFSAFMGCLIAYLLYRGFTELSSICILCASVLLGLNIFVRIPNLALCVIPFVLVSLKYVYVRDARVLLKNSLLILVGICVGVLISIFVNYILGHQTYLVSSLNDLISTGSNNEDRHGIWPMVKINLLNDLFIIINMMAIALMYVIYSWFQKKKIINFVKAIDFIFLIVLIFYFFIASHIGRYASISFVIAFSYCLLLMVAIKQWKNFGVVCLTVITFLVANLQPLGSDYGIGNMGAYSIWLLVPVAIVIALNYEKDHNEGERISMIKKSILVFMAYSMLFYFGISYRNCYRDEGPRLSKTFKSHYSNLENVYTSKERAEALDSLFFYLGKFAKKDDFIILTYDKPGLYYLSETKPFIGHPWIFCLRTMQFEEKLKQGIKKYGKPVVVENVIDIDDKTEPRYISNIKALHNFIKNNEYILVWENKDFKIYK